MEIKNIFIVKMLKFYRKACTADPKVLFIVGGTMSCSSVSHFLRVHVTVSTSKESKYFIFLCITLYLSIACIHYSNGHFSIFSWTVDTFEVSKNFAVVTPSNANLS